MERENAEMLSLEGFFSFSRFGFFFLPRKKYEMDDISYQKNGEREKAGSQGSFPFCCFPGVIKEESSP